ncbi:hypothetical protein NMG60_11008903 [Bertholletia excelsa]
MGGGRRVVKGMFGALALMGLVWLVLVEAGEAYTTSTISPQPAGSFQNVEVVGKEKVSTHEHVSDLNFMSKRRVPNGPDPIHNRRAGNSRQPPGRRV